MKFNHWDHWEHWEHGERWDLKYCDESLIDAVLAAVTEVRRHFGPSLSEPIYEHALVLELSFNGINVFRYI